MPSPVYLITGFLDSGKTTLIKSTLDDPNFMNGVRSTLLIVMEEGEESYDPDWLKKRRVNAEYVDPDELTKEKLKYLQDKYRPSQVVIEYNGTVPVSEVLLNELPRTWVLVQILSTVDATTFEMYVSAMRSIIFEQLRYSDTVIVNRCDENTNAMALRGNIKAINKQAQIYYEGKFGEPADLKDNALPYDLNAPVLDIQNDDYGLWYMDCGEHPEKYEGKEVILRGFYARRFPEQPDVFILGRNAMVCCEQDTSLCGVTVFNADMKNYRLGDWMEVRGKLELVKQKDGEETVIVRALGCIKRDAPKDTYVYFS